MIITKIEKQKKDKHRYNIFLDQEFAFGLYEDSVLKFMLKSGDEINESKVNEMKEFDEIGFGKKVAYSMLAYRQRSKNELIKKLKLKKISAKSIDTIIEILEKQKYLNDEIYAKNFLEDKLNSKPVGKRVAKQKLFEKGIDKELAEETIDKIYSGDKEFDLASALLKKYEKRVKYKNESDKKNKCYRYLISKGFDFETARRVMALPDDSE